MLYKSTVPLCHLLFIMLYDELIKLEEIISVYFTFYSCSFTHNMVCFKVVDKPSGFPDQMDSQRTTKETHSQLSVLICSWMQAFFAFLLLWYGYGTFKRVLDDEGLFQNAVMFRRGIFRIWFGTMSVPFLVALTKCKKRRNPREPGFVPAYISKRSFQHDVVGGIEA